MRIQRSFIQIPGVGTKTEQSLWGAGVNDWRSEIDVTPVGPKTGERIVDFAERAQQALEQEDITFFASRLPSAARWRLLESFREQAVALDIETTGLDPHRDVVTTVTFHDRSGAETLIRGEDLGRERLRDQLADAGVLLTFNGAQFDLPFLEEQFDLTIDRPHVDLRYPCHRLEWTGGLKQIEQHLGIERALPAVDGREAIRLWQQYERGNQAALDRLVRYNREDTRTLLPIADRVVTALDQQVLDPFLVQSE